MREEWTDPSFSEGSPTDSHSWRMSGVSDPLAKPRPPVLP